MLLSEYDAAIRHVCAAGIAIMERNRSKASHAAAYAIAGLTRLARAMPEAARAHPETGLENHHHQLIIQLDESVKRMDLPATEAVLESLGRAREVWQDAIERSEDRERWLKAA